jgi:hypothetical protein
MRARTTTVALLLLLLLLVLKLNCCIFLWPNVEQRLFIFQPLTVQLKIASKESMKQQRVTNNYDTQLSLFFINIIGNVRREKLFATVERVRVRASKVNLFTVCCLLLSLLLLLLLLLPPLPGHSRAETWL